MESRRILGALKLCVLVALLIATVVRPSPGPAAAATVAAVDASGLHTCALTLDGGVKCWGRNDRGQLGDNTTGGHARPVDVCADAACTFPLSDVSAIAAGGRHTCAVTAAGGVKCWGSNRDGRLGVGTDGGQSTIPVDVCADGACVEDLGGAVAVTAGSNYVCVLTTQGGVKCWGGNYDGQLGEGTRTDRTTPVDVTGLRSGVAAVSAGQDHNCVLTTAGGVKCWGTNNLGQLGDATRSRRTTPVDVTGLEGGVAAIAAGWDHSCALRITGGVKCWGSNGSGELGDGTSGNLRTTPVDVAGLESGVAAIAGGSDHTCALTTGGAVKCWGLNNRGQLGDGTTVERATPVDVAGLESGVAAIGAGGDHNCALTTKGRVKCWGRNRYGQLGNGETSDRTSPVDVLGLKPPPAVRIGSLSRTVVEEGSVDLEALNITAPGLGTWVIDVTYDAAIVSLVECVPGAGGSCAPASDDNTIQVAGTSSPGVEGDTTLATITFRCDSAGLAALSLSIEVFVDAAVDDPKDIDPAVEHGGVTCTAPQGDANCDAGVNSIDAALVLQRDAGLIAVLGCEDAADVNADGALDSLDAALILQYDAGLIESLPPS